MDVPNKYNSTFLMLNSTLSLKEVFCHLDQIDKNYTHNPFDEEWKVTKVIKDCLKPLYDLTSHFFDTFPTSNILFKDIYDIQLDLR